MDLEVRFQDGRVEIEPATLPVKLVREGRLLVAVPTIDVPPLRSEVVEATLESLRQERGGGG